MREPRTKRLVWEKGPERKSIKFLMANFREYNMSVEDEEKFSRSSEFGKSGWWKELCVSIYRSKK
jgi:hypothetical protein